MNRDIDKSIMGLNYFVSIQDYFSDIQKDISAWSISDHIDHTIKVNRKIIHAIINNETVSQIKPLKLIGKISLLTAFIPRGKGRTPKEMAPTKPDRATLVSEIYKNISDFQSLTNQDLAKDIYLDHPLFGSLNPKQWMRFLYTHQHHHIKIIKDILNAKTK